MDTNDVMEWLSSFQDIMWYFVEQFQIYLFLVSLDSWLFERHHTTYRSHLGTQFPNDWIMSSPLVSKCRLRDKVEGISTNIQWDTCWYSKEQKEKEKSKDIILVDRRCLGALLWSNMHSNIDEMWIFFARIPANYKVWYSLGFFNQKCKFKCKPVMVLQAWFIKGSDLLHHVGGGF